MLSHNLSYQECVENSEKVVWTLSEVLPSNSKIDFTRMHLPEALVKIEPLRCLTVNEKLHLNHIRGNSYVNLFAFVEEFIISKVINLVGEKVRDLDPYCARALLRFGDEEIKHQLLFKRYLALYERDAGYKPQVLDSARSVSDLVLQKSPLAVLLLILMLELVTQDHYLSSALKDSNLDPLFTSMLRFHWKEEAQHACIDILEIQKFKGALSGQNIEMAFREFSEVLGYLSLLLKEQVLLDIETVRPLCSRKLYPEDLEELERVQSASYVKNFIIGGLQHRTFYEVLLDLHPPLTKKLMELLAQYQDPSLVRRAA